MSSFQALTNQRAHKPNQGVSLQPANKKKHCLLSTISASFISFTHAIGSVVSKIFSPITSRRTSSPKNRTYTIESNVKTNSAKSTPGADYINSLKIRGIEVDKTLEAFADYFDKYCANQSNSVSFKQALILAHDGRLLLQDINNKTKKKPSQQSNLQSPEEYEKEAQMDMSRLTWFLIFEAIAQGKPFTSGMFCLKASGDVMDHFEDHLYPRKSTHFKKRCNAHYGFDIKRDSTQALPVDKRAVAMGMIFDADEDDHTTLYMKMERSGCNSNFKDDRRARTLDSISQLIGHLFDLIESKILKSNGNKPVQKEHMPKELKTSFNNLIQAIKRKEEWDNIPKKDRFKLNPSDKRIEEYGVAYINYLLPGIKKHIKDNNLDSSWSVHTHFEEVKGKIDSYGDSAAYRKGDEVFIDTDDLGNDHKPRWANLALCIEQGGN